MRRKVSLTGQYASVDEDLTGHENLVLVCRLMGLSWADARARATELLGAFGLADAAGRQVRTFSGGMRRRIDIAASLVTTPEVLFLDEPTSGLDPRSRNQVWDLVRQIAADGTTVLLTTQYLEEADRLAERLAVIDHGRVIAEGTSRDLKSTVGSNTLHFHLVKAEQTRRRRRRSISGVLGDGVLPAHRAAAFTVKVTRRARRRPTCWPRSRARTSSSTDFALGTPSLDDVFFALTGRPAEDKADDKTRRQARRQARHKPSLTTSGGSRQGGGAVSADAISGGGGPLPMRGRANPPSALAATGTLAWRALLKIKHVPFQLFDVTITPIMFTLLFTYIFGGALGGTPRQYIQFLLPGILVQTIIFITVYTGVGLNTDIQKGLYDRFRSLPMWQPAPIFGALAGDLFRYSIASALIIGLGLIIGFRPAGGVVGVLLAFALVLVFAVARVVDLDHLRHEGEDARVGDDDELRLPDAADVREQHLRRPGDDAGLAAGRRPPQPGHPPDATRRAA